MVRELISACDTETCPCSVSLSIVHVSNKDIKVSSFKSIEIIRKKEIGLDKIKNPNLDLNTACTSFITCPLLQLYHW